MVLDSNYWTQRYLNDQTGWDRGQPSTALLHWLESEVLQSGKTLVPGCGRGHEVLELATRGFPVTAIDFSQEPIEHLRDRLSELPEHQVELVQANVLEFQPAHEFDFIYEQTCLCAISPSDWKLYEQQLGSWLKTDGQLLICFMQTGSNSGPPFHCEVPQMRKLFSTKKWQWSESSFTVEHPAGLSELAYVLTKL